MPADLLDPSSAPAAPAAAPASSQPAAAAKTTINVSTMLKGGETPKPAKAGSARDRLNQELNKKFGGDTTPAEPAAASPAPAAKAEPEGAEPPPAPSPAPEAPVVAPVAGDDGKGKRPSPWKLVDEYKARATKAETELLEARKQVVPEADRQAQGQKLTQLETWLKEAHDELRYFNAEKYDPDVVSAKTAYETEFNRAMSELGQVTFKDPNTLQDRAMNAYDLFELVTMPLNKARQVCDQLFGGFADDVMAYRGECKRLWDAKQAKIEDLKKTGATREQERGQRREQALNTVKNFVAQTYQRANEEAAKDPKHGEFFRQREGDTEWNTRLDRGFSLVDEAYKSNPLDPRLSPAQRAEIIGKHAAVRNRAAAYGPMRYEIKSLKDKLSKAEAELKSYKESTPAASGRTVSPTPSKPGGMAGVFSALEKISRPG